MNLWLIRRHGWGSKTYVVRARAREEALAIVFGAEVPNEEVVDVVELPHDGEPAIIWSEEDSPDSKRDAEED